MEWRVAKLQLRYLAHEMRTRFKDLNRDSIGSVTAVFLVLVFFFIVLPALALRNEILNVYRHTSRADSQDFFKNARRINLLSDVEQTDTSLRHSEKPFQLKDILRFFSTRKEVHQVSGDYAHALEQRHQSIREARVRDNQYQHVQTQYTYKRARSQSVSSSSTRSITENTAYALGPPSASRSRGNSVLETIPENAGSSPPPYVANSSVRRRLHQHENGAVQTPPVQVSSLLNFYGIYGNDVVGLPQQGNNFIEQEFEDDASGKPIAPSIAMIV